MGVTRLFHSLSLSVILTVSELGFPISAIASEVTLLMDNSNVSNRSTKSSFKIITETLVVSPLVAPTVKVAIKGADRMKSSVAPSVAVKLTM